MLTVTFLEAAATVLGILCVLGFIRQNVWAWPTAALSAILFGIVFHEASLFANMGLQAAYVALAIYGWHQWRGGGPERGGVHVQRLRARQGAALGALVIIAATAILALLVWVAHGVPFAPSDMAAFVAAEPARALDALATAMSLAGTWMQAKKILENWLLWIVTDLVLAGVFLSQGLYFTTALYVLYLAMALAGYRQWHKALP